MASEFSNRFKSLFLIIYAMLILTIAWQCYKRPSHNADMLPYMAIVLSHYETDLDKIHQLTYTTARQQIPGTYYKSITDNSHAFRKEIKNDVSRFFQNVSFFKVKPLYNILVYLFYKTGVPLVKAPILPSLLSFVVITALLFYWLKNSIRTIPAMLISLGIVISPPVLEAARLSTPDALSTAFILLTFHLMFRKSDWHWIAITLSLAILTRLDNIMLAFLILIFHYVFQSIKEGKFSWSWNGIVVIAILLGWTLYGFLIMRYANFQGAFENAFTAMWINKNPITEAIKGLATIQSSYLPTVMIIWGVVIFNYRIDSFKSLTQSQWFYLLMVLYVIIKYGAFPNLTTRFYLPVYIVAIVLIVEELFSRIQTENIKSP